ncbi:ABC-three component system middle component 1 [Pseudomonas sp. NPDC089752]|uniref:ABC-three component system middle component 1 n=1 Tax=Pseudomonas sp. NPDC089752 TaxID=3364472 RepID=UPI0037F6F46C
MITILNNIMASNRFSVVDVDLTDNSVEFILYKADSRKRQEYFLIVDLSTLSGEELRYFLEQTSQEIFEDIQNSGKVELYFEKNCTMIICLNTSVENQDMILALEEDPYNFKKNVVRYSAGELAALNGYLTRHSVTAITNDIINDILNANGGADFLEFKLNHKTGSQLYSLITRIIMKLSFLVYSPREQKLENLAGQIEAAIPVGLTETFDKILTTEWTDEAVIANVESIWGGRA